LDLDIVLDKVAELYKGFWIRRNFNWCEN